MQSAEIMKSNLNNDDTGLVVLSFAKPRNNKGYSPPSETLHQNAMTPEDTLMTPKN